MDSSSPPERPEDQQPAPQEVAAEPAPVEPIAESRPPAATQPPPPASTSSAWSSGAAVGIILVIVGAILLAGQLLDFGFDDLGWPMIIVGVGVALMLIGLFVANESGVVVGGTVVTTVGLVLLYQNETGRWESWAYAWALVGPAASGLGLALWGIRSGDGRDVRNGMWGLLGGLAFFAVGFLFFEGVIGISGEPFPIAEWVLPVVVIGIGLVILARGLVSREEPEGP